ncbi:MAG: biotin carboxylase N-terminal domain-containing protein [Burkholderiaceae bacterium]
MTLDPKRFRPFQRLLVANRGEIACRVISAARALGLHTIAVYSSADRDARHVALADEAHEIGPAQPGASYLDLDALMALAARANAEAVHPGYGFLSEDPRLPEACAEHGLVFVGPDANAMRALGNKIAAKRVAREADVPCLGEALADDGNDTDGLAGTAARIGYPIMIKAAAGGGGRGMRRVDEPRLLAAAIAEARAEALAGFGSDELLIEPWITEARHVEVQVLADGHGKVLHLGERDCSTQRRHQKILEEAPAPGVDDALRARLGDAAVALARAVGYVGAGTVEFLLHGDDRFHFLEMNTRLQVEHPVTEAITGIDLVQWQLRIARGEALDFEQGQVDFQGHAIEARLCAEDPSHDFLPASGPIANWAFPALPGLRVDHGLAETATVSPFYDSMIAKLIAHGPTREIARAKLARGLRETMLHGPATNRSFLIDCLEHPHFAGARLSTQWLTGAMSHLRSGPATSRSWAVAAALWIDALSTGHGTMAGFVGLTSPGARLDLQCGDERATVAVQWRSTAHGQERGGPREAQVSILDQTHRVQWQPGQAQVVIDGAAVQAHFTLRDARAWLSLDGHEAQFLLHDSRERGSAVAGADGMISAPMHGRVASVEVAVGDTVATDQLLLTIEAMKIAHRIEASIGGTVVECLVTKDDQVTPGTLLLRIEVAGD